MAFLATLLQDTLGTDVTNSLLEWPQLLEDHILILSWNASNLVSLPTFWPKIFHLPYIPPSLIKSLVPSHPDREEKDGLIGCDIFDKITLDKYCSH